ncbi:MAG: alpha-L-arabinofuranosidase C-terminal domain-containing protein [Bacteroidia bacterium]|nr:alpha-L-arabinofuranosidase C-terminal domain-containing protein [Bacteroidia bacterium]
MKFFSYTYLTPPHNRNNKMKLIGNTLIWVALLLGNGQLLIGQTGSRQLQLDASATVAPIQSTMYGIFFEDINFGADGGLYAELVKNRSFEFEEPRMGWSQPRSDRFSLNTGSGIGTVMKTGENNTNPNFLRVILNNASGYELINEGFRGMGIHANAKYDLSLQAALPEGNISSIHFQLIGQDGKVLGETSIKPSGSGWKNYESTIETTATDAKAKLKITFEGAGTIDLDMISLFPQDTWMGRKKGLRKDLVQLLYDLKPGFLRFPGGCIVEGRTLAQRYQWKKTIGSADQREWLINRWNTEFAHRPAPDYFQSFGLGFFEYFQLAEDLGATPLPILSCGMACQFNTAELVPMDELDPYIQDALDLIEFANGSADSPWGKIRAEMGHPEPFGMKLIGVGNEQWGPEYIKRYIAFEQAIKSKYPDIIIVSGSGPFPDGEFYEYGMDELGKLDAEIVDEHYYRSPQWFRENATRYDNYDRQGPKIFAGEYAAQSVATASPDNKNNWNCALSEAAFMTGLERNADVVYLTSYAPLLAHAEGWQWTPDLIWFDNLAAYGTPNYYVQKLFSNHKGTDLLRVTEGDKPLTGQGELYASAVLDKEKGEFVVKLVNTADHAQEATINLKGGKTKPEAKVFTLTAGSPEAINALDNPQAIYPTEKTVAAGAREVSLTLPAASMTVLRVGVR